MRLERRILALLDASGVKETTGKARGLAWVGYPRVADKAALSHSSHPIDHDRHRIAGRVQIAECLLNQFTSIAFLKIPKDREIRISMDGRGAWMDTDFVEQRAIECKKICPRACASRPEARAGIGWNIFVFFTTR